MTMQEWELRDAWRFAVMAAAFVGVAVLQGFAGRWWLVVAAVVIAVLHAVVSVGSWGLAKLAEPWMPPIIRRPGRWVLWGDVVSLAAVSLLTVWDLLAGKLLDAASWALLVFVGWLHFRHDREARQLTEPAEPVRPGHPGEWLP